MLLSAALLALAAPAFAQDDPSSDEPPVIDTAATAAAEPAKEPRKRKFLMEVGFRGRYMDLPDSLLDLAYFRNDDDDTIPDRPHVSAYSLGIEFVIKDEKANGIFYVEYLNPLIKPGYWDDKEEPADHQDGSWMEPDKLGLVLIGANYAYELKANNWFSFLFGAGIGGAIKIGELREWQPGEDVANPDGNNNNTEVDCGPAGQMGSAAYERRLECEDDGTIETPPVLPYIDINVGPRFNISDRASIRLEGGIHALLPYGGASVGITF
jgi:hypothetical protein